MPVSNLTPTTIEIKVEESAKVVVGGLVEHTFYVNGQEYKELPLDANVREPDVAKSKPYKDMMATLENEPEKFLENNLGISVIAENVVPSGTNKFKLTFPSGTGILNGGHTQRAILDSQTDPNIINAIVKLSVREKAFTAARIAEMASAQNSSTAVKEYSLAEKKGYYAEIKAKMDPNYEKHIKWYEGKKVSADLGIEPPELISILSLFDIVNYQGPYNASNAQPNFAFNSKKAAFDKWVSDPSDLKIIYPLINDIIKLSEHIRLVFTKKTGMARLQVVSESKNTKGSVLTFSGQTPDYIIHKAFLYAALSAFRANIYYDATAGKIGWIIDPIALCDSCYVDLFKRISEAYKKSYHNEIKKVGSDPMIWQILYMAVDNIVKTERAAGKVYIDYDI